MPKIAKELTALEVARLKEDGIHAVGVVPGLHLQIRQTSRAWILRAMVGGKRRDIGLGSFPEVSLARAREAARNAREAIKAGIDPILAKRQAQSALKAEQARALTFADAARQYLDAKSDEWRNAKHRQQWINTLRDFAEPVLGRLHVADIRTEHVLAVLNPIWKTKTETASRVRGRIESVLDWATARGYREGENPARWRGHLDMMLPAPTKIAKVEHQRALPIDAFPGFLQALRLRDGMGARALELVALTATRSGEVRGAKWAEINLEHRLWIIPGERMKAGKEHRVPLSKAAHALLKSLPHQEGTDLVFPGFKDRPLSDATLNAVMERMGVDAVTHGLRSTFRDWASERTAFPSDIAEMALAHTIKDKTEAAYRRGDLLEKRRQLMEAWAEFGASTPASGENVVAIRKATE